MTPVPWILALAVGLGLTVATPGRGSTFPTHVRPLLEAKCSPCHFEGGKVYAKLPFDRPATVRALGERLFTRLKEPKDQALIRAFLAEAPEGEAPR